MKIFSGTSHADEIGYIFPRKGLPSPKKGSRSENIIRKAVHLLKHFCYYGNPALCQNDNVSTWQPLQPNETHFLDFGNEIQITTVSQLERMKLWQKILNCDRRNTKLSTLRVV